MNSVYGIDTETVKVRRRVGDKEVEEHEFYSFQIYPPGLFLTHPEKVAECLSNLPPRSRLLGWNVEFDLLVLRKILSDDWRVRIFRNRSRFVRGEIRKDKLVLYVYDLHNLLPLRSFAEVGKLIGLEKLERPPYLGERPPRGKEEQEYFRRYALRDAEIAYRAGLKLLQEFKVLKPTLPSLSLSIFNRDFGGRGLFLRLPEEVETLAWKAYKGGRTECFYRGTPDFKVRLYDFRSLYPFCMLIGNFPFFKSYVGQKGDVNLEHYGLADVLVQQDAEIPLLGVKRKFKDGSSKLIFPGGKVRGVFTYDELYRLEQWGAGKILKVYKAVEWAEGSRPFKSFILEYYAHRGEGENQSRIFKLFLNALYGKFGQNPDMEGVEIFPNGELDRKALGTLKVCNPVIAAYITALARLQLWKVFRDVGFKHVFYCDTDSIITDKTLETGKELGELKLEGETENLTLVRSKCYIFGDVLKWKGLTLRSLPDFPKRTAGEIARELIRQDNFKVMEKILLRTVYAHRLKIPYLSELLRWKVFSLEPDGKRVFPHPLRGAELLHDWVSSQPLKLQDPENENEVIDSGALVVGGNR